jgi:preprotein translocase subunit YajC
MMALLFAAMYFLMIRPQQRRRRAVEEMQSKMGPGDEVVTVGGLYAIVQAVEDDTVLLEIAPDVFARYARASISKVVTPAGTATTEDDDETGDEIVEESGADVDATGKKKVVDSD